MDDGRLQTRDRILAVSIGLFAARGYDALGVAEICSRCDISKPTLYHHFESKEGLFLQVMMHSIKTVLAPVQSLLVSRGDLVGEVESILAILEKTHHEFPAEYGLVINSFLSAPDSDYHRLSAESRAAFLHAFEGYFETAGKAHGNLKNKQEQLPWAFLGLLLALLMQRGQDRATIPADNLHQMARIFLHGVFS